MSPGRGAPAPGPAVVAPGAGSATGLAPTATVAAAAPDAAPRADVTASARAVPASLTRPRPARPVGAAAAVPRPLPPAPDTASGGAGVPARTPGPRRLVRVPVLRVVCWEIAGVLVLLAVGRPWPMATGLYAAAALVLSLGAIRVRGSWLSDLMARRSGLALRRREADLAGAADPAGSLLQLLAPGAVIGTAELAGTAAAVISRPGERLTVLRAVDATPGEFARRALAGALPSETDLTMPRLRLQLVVHRGPAVGAARPVPRAWLAVRALREADIADDADLHIALNNTVRRLLRRLREAGCPALVLDEAELRATLTALSHVGPGRTSVREDWRCWRAGPVAQVGLRAAAGAPRPGSDRAAVLECLLAAVPGVAVTVAVDAADPAAPAALRVASTTAAAADAAASHLRSIGPRLGLQLERGDGQHARAVAATLPIGGDPS